MASIDITQGRSSGSVKGHTIVAANNTPRDCRRVRFVDESSTSGPLPSNSGLVTRTAFRPSTTLEEKSLLYYNSRDHEFFALEDYHRKMEVRTRSCRRSTKRWGWEDFMVREGDYCEDEELCTSEEEDKGKLRRVKTLHELQS